MQKLYSPTTTSDKELQFMPVMKNKRPIHKQWEKTKIDYDYSNAEAIGLVCGEISGNLEAIDIDLKYDISGKLFLEYKRAINEIDKTILPLLVVQKTVNNGYHFIYRCDTIEGNKKLAQRATTTQEREETYKRSYASKLSELTAKEHDQAKAIEESVKYAIGQRDNDKVRVLLETRGEKGFIACYPSDGYEIIYGSLDKINTITTEQRQVLFDVAFSFNEVLKEGNHHRKLPRKEIKGLTPSEDFDDRGDVVALLEKHGWTQAGRRGHKILMKRPGDTSADSSGNYDTEKKWFSVFSTSTEFDPQTAYKPYAVYAMLECDGDFTQVTKKLADEGYGDPYEFKKEASVSVPSIVDMSSDDLSFLAVPEDYNDYLNRWRNGTFEMGKTTGLVEMDKHFLFKEGDLVIINGIDNVGKSTVIWYLSMLSAMYNEWKWLIFSSENKVGGVVRKLIEFYCDKPIDTLSDEEFKVAKDFVESHYDIIKTGDKLFNYKDILNMTAKAMVKTKYKGLMIDPYNSLKVDIPPTNKQNTYGYHYEAASEIQLFGRRNNISIFLNCHVGTTGARNKNSDGFTKAPQKEDTEMGVMFANKADQFLTIHRFTQCEQEFMFTEIHVRKVKETETGGRVTPYHSPVLLRGKIGLTGFENTFGKTLTEHGQNAVEDWKRRSDGNGKMHQSSFFNDITPVDFSVSKREDDFLF